MNATLRYNLLSYTCLTAVTFLLIYLTDRYILTIDFYEHSGDPVAALRSQEASVYANLQKWIYLSSALYLLFKLSGIALILYTALYLSGHILGFGRVFNIVAAAETVFFIPAILKLLCFPHFYPSGTLSDWHGFYILSALSIAGHVPADWSYALQTLNLFEVAYWFILAYGIYRSCDLSYDRSLKLVVCSYLPALVIGVAFVTLFVVVMSPTTG